MKCNSGRCLCGATKYEFKGPVRWQGHCHCESCRRNCSAPFTSYFGVPRSTSQWTGDKTGIHESSPGVRRYFCKTCGTPMAYDSDEYTDEIHFYAASLDDPTDFKPTFHVFYAERLPWVNFDNDGLQKFDGAGLGS